MYNILVINFVLLFGINNCNSQRTNYGEVCNNTEECSDHRYACQKTGEDDIFRCLCDRFHSWMGEYIGCVQIYNASEIMNMTVISVTEINIGQIEEEVEQAMQTHIAAGLFVFGMIMFGFVAVSVFCIYIRRKDLLLSTSVKAMVKEKEEKEKLASFHRPSTSAVVV